ncbi:MAG: peptide-methionine (R)-S-oxide reductase MsrB [Sphingomonadaceae bacterium]|nr:peptide-methionine (R)-S-oxide reductase MsrB [Sphingomonadaceae bacterium]
MPDLNDAANGWSRRKLLTALGATASLPVMAACGSGDALAKSFPVEYGEAQWRKRLTAEQFFILRQEGTERPYSSALLKEKHKGIYVCAADGSRLFSSATKYDSRTGWPSFWKPLPGGTGTSTDYKLGYPRTEVHCATCGGHLGHVFNDGPRPTGKRYCINGDAMEFRAG